ncbi:MAG: alpha/beta hydrolase [Acetobacteraceae bacterium]
MTVHHPDLATGNAGEAPELVLMHGWGYDATLWNDVASLLAPLAVTKLEAGYFGAAPFLTLPTRPFIAIGHSAGGLWFLKQNLTHCRAVILINSFTRFTRGEDFPLGQAPSIPARMSRRLATAPKDVITTFRKNIGDSSTFNNPVTNRLMSGLADLTANDARHQARIMTPPLYALAGSDDPLIPPPLSRMCFENLHHLAWAEGGHMLPLAQPHSCARFIRNILDDLHP